MCIETLMCPNTFITLNFITICLLFFGKDGPKDVSRGDRSFYDKKQHI